MRRTLAAILAVVPVAVACAVSPVAPANGSPEVAAAQVFCVDETNRLRATVGLAPLVRATDLEAFSIEAARFDGTSHMAHSYFVQTNGAGVSKAQNEILWWLFSQYHSLRTIVKEGLAVEWAEGVGGGHHDTITGNYKEAGCGIWIANGEVTVAQDFR